VDKFDEFFKVVLGAAKDIGGEAVQSFLKEGTVESKQFMQVAKADLERWTTELAKGDMDRDMFEYLIRGQADAAVLAALAKAAQTGKKAEIIRKKVADVAIKAAFTILLA
jgi:hypothetical protein